MTDSEAYNFIFGLVATAWAAGVPAIAADSGTGKPDDPYELRFKGKEDKDNPSGFWAWSKQDIVEQEIRSMSDENTFGMAQKRYETFGISITTVYAPKSLWNASKRGFQIAQVIRDAFRANGQAGAVWFQNARINTLVDDDINYRWNVVADFRYDTIA